MRYLYSFLCLLFLPSLLFAQHPALRSMKAALKEKIKVGDIASWLESLPKTDTVTSHDEGTSHYAARRSTFGEARIGNTQKPESEIHAAIDPKDSSRMMVAVMRHDPFATSPLSFSFYSTDNFGQTWFQSPFRANETGNDDIAGGGDPVVVYDSNGKAHVVWLLLTFSGLSQSGKVGLYYASTDDQGLSWTQGVNNPKIYGNLVVPQGSNEITATDKFVDKPWLAIDPGNGPFRDQLYAVYHELQLSPDTVPTIQCARKSRTGTNFSSNSVQVHSQSYVDMQFSSVDVDMDGIVHVSFLASKDGSNYDLYHAKSINGGSSFEPETKIARLAFPAPSAAGSFPSNIEGVDRLYPCPHIRVDKSDGPFRGYLYATWTARGTGQGSMSNGYDIYFARSTDGGQNWSFPAKVNDDMNGDRHQFYSSIEVSPKGIVMLTWYDRREDANNQDTHYYLAYSSDGGVSFDDQFAVSSQSSDFSKIGDTNEGFGIGEYTQLISSPGHAIPFWADGRRNNGEVKVYTGMVPIDAEATVGLDRWQSLSDGIQGFDLYPNPVSDVLTISWAMTSREQVSLSLIDVQGREVIKKDIGQLPPGEHSQQMNLKSLSSGMYMLRLEAGEASIGKRLQVKGK